MLLKALSEGRHIHSILIAGLLAVGAVGWFSPTMASTRRSGKMVRPSATQREIVIPMSTPSTEVCVQGTSIAGSRSVAIIDGQVVHQGQQISSDGKHFSVVEIAPESVRLREVPTDKPQATTTERPSLFR